MIKAISRGIRWLIAVPVILAALAAGAIGAFGFVTSCITLMFKGVEAPDDILLQIGIGAGLVIGAGVVFFIGALITPIRRKSTQGRDERVKHSRSARKRDQFLRVLAPTSPGPAPLQPGREADPHNTSQNQQQCCAKCGKLVFFEADTFRALANIDVSVDPVLQAQRAGRVALGVRGIYWLLRGYSQQEAQQFYHIIAAQAFRCLHCGEILCGECADETPGSSPEEVNLSFSKCPLCGQNLDSTWLG